MQDLVSYPAIVTRAADGISISFPDFPMICTSAESEDELTETMEHALGEAIALTISQGLPLPDPSRAIYVVAPVPAPALVRAFDRKANLLHHERAGKNPMWK